MTVTDFIGAGTREPSVLLARTRPLPATLDPSAFLAAIAQRLSPAHATFFAVPRAAVAGTEWYAPHVADTGELPPGTHALTLDEVSGSTRRAALKHASAVFSAIRRIAQTEDGVIRATFPSLQGFASPDAIRIIGNRPVLSHWGVEASHALSAYDDGIPPTTRAPFWPALVPLGQTARAGVALGFLAIAALGFRLPPAHRCLASTAQELDAVRWVARDASVMHGCWSVLSHHNTIDSGSHDSQEIATWRICLAPDGRSGTQHILYQDGSQCSSAVRSGFEGDVLSLHAARCYSRANHYLVSNIYDCRRTPDAHAACDIHADDPTVSAAMRAHVVASVFARSNER